MHIIIPPIIYLNTCSRLQIHGYSTNRKDDKIADLCVFYIWSTKINIKHAVKLQLCVSNMKEQLFIEQATWGILIRPGKRLYTEQQYNAPCLTCPTDLSPPLLSPRTCHYASHNYIVFTFITVYVRSLLYLKILTDYQRDVKEYNAYQLK